MRERLLIIGNGMASVRLVETLIARDPRRFAITVVGAEPVAAYNRVLLSALLAGDCGEEDIALRPSAWYRDHGMELAMGDPVICVDTSTREARLASGRAIGFDACVFATGSAPVRLPITGIDKPGVMSFRDLSDVTTMAEAATSGARVAVIGGGLLGIEAAYGLARRGARVTLVHVMDRLMERQLDAAGAALLRRAIEARGITVRLAHQTVAVSGDARADGLIFADGSRLDADLVVSAAGITPRTELAAAAGLATGRGILVDDGLAASIPGFFAIGECAEHRGVAYGQVEPTHLQASVLAERLCGGAARFEGLVLATNLKVSGVPVFSAGEVQSGDGTSASIVEDRSGNGGVGHYRKLIFHGDRLVGCVMVGEADDALWYLDLIRSGADISAIRRDLAHGRAFVAEPVSCPPADAAYPEAA